MTFYYPAKMAKMTERNYCTMPLKKEKWDLYNSEYRRVGTMYRGEKVPVGLYHLAVEVIPTDMKGHLLVTKRSYEKRRGAGMMEFPAGSVISGEDPTAAAARELYEETGLRAENLVKLQRKKIYGDGKEGSGMIRLTYLAIIPDLLNATVTLQEGETIGYRIITFQEWVQMLLEGSFEKARSENYGQALLDYIRDNIGTSEVESVKPEKKTVTLRKAVLPERSEIEA